MNCVGFRCAQTNLPEEWTGELEWKHCTKQHSHST